MMSLVRAELLKYRTTRLSWGMALAMFLAGAAFAALIGGLMLSGGFQLPDSELSVKEVVPELTLARLIYTAGIQLGYLLALVVGVLSIGQEFRHKTATSTFLAAPRRYRVVLAKVAALVVIAVVNGILHLAGGILGGGIFLWLNDLPLFPDPPQLLRTLALALLVLAVWSLIGLGVGVLITNQIAALFIAVAVVWIVEPLAGFGLTFLDGGDAFARFFPSQATSAALDVFTGMDSQLAEAMGSAGDQLVWWAGALVLLAYAAIMTTVGVWLTQRRDID
jgi:ABC-2 type transport system permease protein